MQNYKKTLYPRKKVAKSFVNSEKLPTFALAIETSSLYCLV